MSVQFIHLGIQLRIDLQEDIHLVKEIIAGDANRVFCQELELNEVTHGKSAPGELAQWLIGASVHVGYLFWCLVVSEDVQGRDGKLALEEGLVLRKDLMPYVLGCAFVVLFSSGGQYSQRRKQI